MGKASRSKGRRGQREAIELLRCRGFAAEELNAGKEAADLLAIQGDKVYYVEVKNTASINVKANVSQAVRQAGGKNWMLLCRIHGYAGHWLVLRKGKEPEIWTNQCQESSVGS